MSHFVGKIALHPPISSTALCSPGRLEGNHTVLERCWSPCSFQVMIYHPGKSHWCTFGIGVSCLFTGHGTWTMCTGWTQHRTLQAGGWCCILAVHSAPGVSSQHPVTAQSWSSGKQKGKSRVGGRINKYCDISCFLTKLWEIETTTFESPEMIWEFCPSHSKKQRCLDICHLYSLDISSSLEKLISFSPWEDSAPGFSTVLQDFPPSHMWHRWCEVCGLLCICLWWSRSVCRHQPQPLAGHCPRAVSAFPALNGKSL